MTVLAQPGANLSMQNTWLSYTPVLQGQADNPVATYTTQIGKFMLVGPLVFFKFAIVTSGTTTKTTLTDLFAVSLPLASATNAGTSVGEQFACRVENATPVNNAQLGLITSAVSQAVFQAYVIGTVAKTITWQATTLGIGVLSNVITAVGSGVYEYSPV